MSFWKDQVVSLRERVVTLERLTTALENGKNQLLREIQKMHNCFPGQNERLINRLETLERQVQCGINGHSWVLEDVVDLADAPTQGLFTCTCGANIIRDLTSEEIKAAKKLGF